MEETYDFVWSLIFGLLGFAGFVGIILKLLGYLTWSWWIIVAPLWIPALILLVLFIVFITTHPFG